LDLLEEKYDLGMMNLTQQQSSLGQDQSEGGGDAHMEEVRREEVVDRGDEEEEKGKVV